MSFDCVRSCKMTRTTFDKENRDESLLVVAQTDICGHINVKMHRGFVSFF